MAEPACYANLRAGRYEIIRKKIEVEGKSQRGTAKELGHARRKKGQLLTCNLRKSMISDT